MMRVVAASYLWVVFVVGARFTVGRARAFLGAAFDSGALRSRSRATQMSSFRSLPAATLE